MSFMRRRGGGFPNLSNTMMGLLVVMFVVMLVKTASNQMGYQIRGVGWISAFDAQWGLVSPLFAKPLADELTGSMGWPIVGWISHIFVHTSFWHLAGNVIGLISFGPQIERLIGSTNMLIVFMLSALVGAAAEFYLNYNQFSVLIGASGGVAGLIGAAYFFTPPQAKLWLYMVLPVPIRLGIVIIVAIHLLMIALDVDGIAWIAHLGGLVTGGILGVLMFSQTRATRIWRDGLNWKNLW